MEGQQLSAAVFAASMRCRSPDISQDSDGQTRELISFPKKRKNKGRQSLDNGEIPSPTKKPEKGKKNAKMKGTATNAINVADPTISVVVSPGRAFAEVLGKIRTDLKPETCKASISCTTKTAKGDIILRLGKGSPKEALATEIKKVIGDLGEISTKEKKIDIEVRNLDSLTVEQEVEEALRKTLTEEE